ncbi:hypothetical protein Tcan_06051 [Toxocara canis]|uniref:Uncharacterized protein n=1 Tax=Toxocara canis TaxID=6265 RepID=A0A0B2V617_TOXCA|nr:hypothetical protein Tcan_06051 [Toxocara canis]
MLLRAFLFLTSTVMVQPFLFGGGGGCGCGCSPPPPPPTVRCAPPGGFKCPPCGCGNPQCAGGGSAPPPPVSMCNQPRPPSRCECGCGRKKREMLGWSQQNKLHCDNELLNAIMLTSVNNSTAVWARSMRIALRIHHIDKHYLLFCSAIGSKVSLNGDVACEATHGGKTCRLVTTRLAKTKTKSLLSKMKDEKTIGDTNL